MWKSTFNIRQRRGEKVRIFIPIYEDINTNLKEKTKDEPYPGNIYMDAVFLHFFISTKDYVFIFIL